METLHAHPALQKLQRVLHLDCMFGYITVIEEQRYLLALTAKVCPLFGMRAAVGVVQPSGNLTPSLLEYLSSVRP